MSACGLTCAMISRRSFMLGVVSLRAISFLWSGSLSPREVVIRPLESTMKIACAPQRMLQICGVRLFLWFGSWSPREVVTKPWRDRREDCLREFMTVKARPRASAELILLVVMVSLEVHHGMHLHKGIITLERNVCLCSAPVSLLPHKCDQALGSPWRP